MKRVLILMLSCIIGIVMLLVSVGTVSAEEKTSNRFNVVYVLDNSGSMEDTDPSNMRYEAASLFTSLLANDGNYVGTVVFADDIKLCHPVEEIKSFEDKKKLIAEIEKTEIKGWTNIGDALMTAEEMLEKNGNPNIDSVILFLTDGNTEMGTAEETQKSLEAKAEAIQKARDNGVRIFSVCLNAKGVNANAVNPKEMKQIADATAGEYIEVTSDDLTGAFTKFYEMIYSTKADDIGGGVLDENGIFSDNFDIPYAGVEEVNVIIYSEKQLADIKLTKPDGSEISGDAVKDMLISSKNYNVLKVISPEGGKWKLTVKGDPSIKVQISMMFNGNLSIDSAIEDAKDTYQIGDKVTFKSVVSTNGQSNADENVLKDYAITTFVTDQNNKTVELPVSFSNGGFVSEFDVQNYGTYTFYATIEGNGLSATSGKSEIYVGNTPPVVKEESITKTVNLWPFVELDFSVDLAGNVTDSEDENLSFSIDSTSFLEESYELDGTVLSMKDFDISKGSFTVRATDSMGASVTFEVYMISRNIPLYVAIGLGIIIFLIVAITLLKLYLDRGRYFKGSISVDAEYADGTTVNEIRTKKCGRYKLSGFRLPPMKGFTFSKMYFQALNGKEVELRSKKGFRTNTTGKKMVKKLRIGFVTEVIYVDDSGNRLKIQFISK